MWFVSSIKFLSQWHQDVFEEVVLEEENECRDNFSSYSQLFSDGVLRMRYFYLIFSYFCHFLYSQVASVETIIVKSVQNKKAGERFMYFQNKASLLYYSEKCACSQMCRFYVRFFCDGLKFCCRTSKFIMNHTKNTFS